MMLGLACENGNQHRCNIAPTYAAVREMTQAQRCHRCTGATTGWTNNHTHNPMVLPWRYNVIVPGAHTQALFLTQQRQLAVQGS